MKAIVYKWVKWIDSRGTTGRWGILSEIENKEPCICISVGVVIKENAEFICLAGHIGIEDDCDHLVCGEMIIPKCSVLEQKELHEENQISTV